MISDLVAKLPEEERRGWLRLAERFTGDRREGVLVISLRMGDTLVRMQDKADKVYLLMSGTVMAQNEHEDGTVYAYAVFEAPSLFGEFEAFAGSACYRGTLVCQTGCRLALISREDYLKWMRSDAETLFFRVSDITRKLMSQARNERRYLFMSGSSRLAAFLADAYERRQKDGILALAITRQQLADELGVSGKTVQRAIKALREQALVTVRGRKLMMNHEQYEQLQTLSAQKQNDFDSEV